MQPVRRSAATTTGKGGHEEEEEEEEKGLRAESVVVVFIATIEPGDRFIIDERRLSPRSNGQRRAAVRSVIGRRLRGRQ